VFALQRAAGNQAVSRLLHRRPAMVSRMVLQMHGSFESESDKEKLVEGARMLRLKEARGAVIVVPKGDEAAFAKVAAVGPTENVYILR
jgi:hypothetical protein